MFVENSSLLCSYMLRVCYFMSCYVAFCCLLRQRFRAHRTSSKLLDYFLRSNKSNIYSRHSFVVLLCFIDPRVGKIKNDASCCPGIFSSTLSLYYVASSPGFPLPHLVDGRRDIVGCSVISSISCPGPVALCCLLRNYHPRPKI